jgi:hypothetical protein
MAFVVWDGGRAVSFLLDFDEGREMLMSDSCPAEEQCLCDVFGVGDCS